MRLILASASPRRAELLASAGYDFDVVPTEVDERPGIAELPEAYALRVARDKAAATGLQHSHKGCVVLAADTVVAVDGQILGKPRNPEDSRRMLRLLSGGTHEVHTAVVLRTIAGERAELETTLVRFVPLEDADIEWYIASGEPEGKAGAYAIQGLAARFIDRIEGSWSNVVGLPVARVARMLQETPVGD